MADEIDIEEHNLLENPILKNIFPDISKLKQEILNSYDLNNEANASTFYEEREIHNIIKKGKDDTVTATRNSFVHVIKIEHTEEPEDVGNDSSYNDASNDTTNILTVCLNESPHSTNPNKLIVGSYNAEKEECQSIEHFESKTMHLRIMLKDVRPYLKRSKRFCKKCLILFSEPRKYKKHDMKYHCVINIPKDSFKNTVSEANLRNKPKDCSGELITLMSADQIPVISVQRMNGLVTKTDMVDTDKINQFSTDGSAGFKSHIYQQDNSTNNAKAFKRAKQIKGKQYSKNMTRNESSVTSMSPKIRKKRNYQCDKCPTTCGNPYILNKHKQRHEFQDIAHKSIDKELNSKNDFCKHCNMYFQDHNEFIDHLYKIIQNKTSETKIDVEVNEHNNELIAPVSSLDKNNCKKQLLLRSVLFKCQKCDIHFIFAEAAMNHTKHMDILVNWKCPTCSRIFKIEDKYLHRMQHADNNVINVYDLYEKDFYRVLYNCPKCTVHFREDIFLQHYFTCGKTIPQSRYCSHCDVLVENLTMHDHEKQHKYERLSLDDFIFIVTDVIHLTKETKKVKSTSLLKMYFCGICKCFVTKPSTHSRNCLKQNKIICKLCGLLIASESMARHGRLHSIHGNLKLTSFKFYDMKSENQISPPVPTFPSCTVCRIHFTSEVATKRHICGEKVFSVCKKCNEKFTPVALKLHTRFHSYVLPVQVQSSSSKDIDKQNNEKKSNIVDFSKIHQSESDKINDLSEVKIPSDIPSVLVKMFEKEPVVLISKLKLPLTKQTKTVATEQTQNIVYYCNSCELCFHDYDITVQHCQLHLEDMRNVFNGIDCTICGLEFETKSYEQHKHMHRSGNVHLVKVTFDLDYFIQENKIWTNHIFKSIPLATKNAILNHSIYRFEVRIKLTVAQEGPPALTIYHCVKCDGCVSENILDHVKRPCLNVRKHICAICGLPFVSFLSKIEHEEAHLSNERLAMVDKKSYRIVYFNRDEDNKSNNRVLQFSTKKNNMKYDLHQCRNCNGIINIYKFHTHFCKPCELQKCVECGLLIYKKHFSLHADKHRECVDYSPQKMRIILCGQKSEVLNDPPLPSFSGFVCDYTFYKCVQCGICLKDFQRSIHSCLEGKNHCSLCDLYFPTNVHQKLHEIDTQFVRENINIIPFVKQDRKLVKKIVPSLVKLLYLYKCPKCPLHFSDKQSILTHIVNCGTNLKISILTCTKCDLAFTSSSLFKHLIQYHGCNDNKYNFKVVDVNSFIITFKCFNCMLHFETYSKAFEHIYKCKNANFGVKCTYCQLTLGSSCLEQHEERHYKNNKALKTVIVRPSSFNDQIDPALGKRIELAKDMLSQMCLDPLSSILYRCDVCDIYFLDNVSFFTHTLHDLHDNSIIRDKCKICNFDFIFSSLTPHVYVHHIKWGLQKDEFVVINSLSINVN